MKGIIIYKGKYGATAQYANWLSEEFGLHAVPAQEMMNELLEDYHYVVLGSSVYIGRLQLTSWLKENREALTGKKIFFFLVAATRPSETRKLNEYISNGIPDPLRDNMEVYFLHGKMHLKELSWKDRFMLSMGARLTKNPLARKKMLTDFDGVRREALEPLIKSLGIHISNAGKKIISKPITVLRDIFHTEKFI